MCSSAVGRVAIQVVGVRVVGSGRLPLVPVLRDERVKACLLLQHGRGGRLGRRDDDSMTGGGDLTLLTRVF
jgi:hypothetical protein